jgi:hypothetical protein
VLVICTAVAGLNKTKKYNSATLKHSISKRRKPLNDRDSCLKPKSPETYFIAGREVKGGSAIYYVEGIPLVALTNASRDLSIP